MSKFLQGIFRPKNIGKYRGDYNNIVYRSSYELSFMSWCDRTTDVLEWSSEEHIIPYRSPLDGKTHRYFVDFYVKVKDKNGQPRKYLVEVKPHAQTIQPMIVEGKTPKKSQIKTIATWAVNQAKWESAKAWCKSRNMEFLIITEKNLGLLG